MEMDIMTCLAPPAAPAMSCCVFSSLSVSAARSILQHRSERAQQITVEGRGEAFTVLNTSNLSGSLCSSRLSELFVEELIGHCLRVKQDQSRAVDQCRRTELLTTSRHIWSKMMEVEPLSNYSYDYLEYGDFEEPEAKGYVQKETLHIISVVIYSLAFLLGVTGNGIVIWVTAFKSKRTINSVWLQNLAIADFVFVLFLPFSIDYVLRDFNWIFGWNMCKLNSFICTVNMYASVLFLTVLSLDRYVSLVHLVWCQKHRTTRRAWGVCALTWVVSILLSSPALIFRETVQFHDKVVCFNNFHDENGHTAVVRHIAMVTIRTTVGFLLPFATIIITAVLLARKMKQSANIRLSSFSKTISAIVLAFFLCWAPFHTFSLMELTMHHSLYLHKCLTVGFPLATSLAFFNSCLNPILYVLVSKNARAILKRSCMNIAKQSLRGLNQSLSATESASAPASCTPEELSVCSHI